MVRRAFFVGLLMVASCPVLDLGVAMWCLGSQTIVDSIWFWLRAGRPSAVEPTEIDMKTPQIDQHTTLEELSELITPPVSTSQHPVDPTMCRLLTVMTSTHESFRDPIFFGFTYREIRSDEEDGLPALVMLWERAVSEGLRIEYFFVQYTAGQECLSFAPREPWVGFQAFVATMDDHPWRKVAEDNQTVDKDQTLVDLSSLLRDGCDQQERRFHEWVGAVKRKPEDVTDD